jgi:cellulose synthase operon protein C
MLLARIFLTLGIVLMGDCGVGLAQSSREDLPPLPVDGPSPQRPSFLPLPQSGNGTVVPRLKGSPRPRTMKTVVELPVPEPVAGPPAEEQADPGPSPGTGGKVVFGEAQPEQSPVEAGSAQPVVPEASTEPAVVRPLVQNDGKPGILFGDESPSPKPTPELPTPSPAPSVVPRRAVPRPTPAVEEPDAQEDVQSLLKQKRFAEVEPIATEQQDGGLARALGWGYYNSHSYTRGVYWFQTAIQWNEDDYEAAYGLALCLTREGEYDKAEQVARWRLDQYPSMRKVLGDLATQKAMAAYKGKEYRQSLQLFAEVETYRALSRDEQIVEAWCYFQTGDYTKAAQEFETLYAAKQDKFAASGVYASEAKLKNWPRIAELSKTYDGPLAALYQTYIVERYYDHRLYANVQALAPQKYPELQGYTSPIVAANGFGRFKSGDQGTSRLTELRADAVGSFYQDDINRFSLDIGGTYLDAGTLPQSAFIGQVPLTGPRVYQFAPKTSSGALVDLRAGYQRSSFYTPTVELGISPVGGALDPTLVGKAGLTGIEEWGNWDVSLYRNSVKQSILSYTGFKDPYSGVAWGRVSEDGLSVSAYDNLAGGWGLYGQFGISILEGENVETNNHLSLAISLNRQIENPNFTFLTVGPAFSFEHYAQNQDFFTFGHGGYFSPNYVAQGAVALRFLTKEARSYLLKGEVLAGLQTYEQDSAPIFPLNNSVASYPGSTASTFIATARIAGLFLLTPQWAVGGSVDYSKTANYSEFTAAAFLRFFFEPRVGLFGTDFQ